MTSPFRCPFIANCVRSSASLEFLRDVTEGAGKSIIQRCLTDENLLQTELIGDVPDEHRPDDEFIAARLKIPHEARTRMAAKAQRKIKRTKAHGFYSTGDEIWMHCRPDGEELRNWRVKNRCTFGSDDDVGREEEVELRDEAKDMESASEDVSGEDFQRTEVGKSSSNTSQENWLGCKPSLKSGPSPERERP